MGPAKLIFAAVVIASLLCAQSTGSIAGIITNSTNGAPIEGVNVRAACSSQAATRCQSASAVTNSAGAFRIPARPDGQYLMSVEKEGFSPGLSNPALAVADSKEARFDVKMTPLASLSGRVVDPEGKPVAGVAVQFGLARPVMTDDQGNFIFQKLNPSRAPLSAKVKPQPPGKDGERMVTTYYPSSISADQGIPVDVQGTDLSGYEIRLRTAQARSIRGVLLDADGTPMPHANVTLSKPAGPSGIIPIFEGVYSPVARVTAAPSADYSETESDGTFEFPAVPEGDWILKGSRLGSGPGTRQSGSIELRVGRSDIDNLTFRLTKSFPIEISQEVSDSQSSDPPRASTSILPLDGQLLASSGVDADPPFTSHNQGLPGHYLIAPGSATLGYYVSAAMLNGRNVLGLTVELSGPTEVKLVLKKDGGTLQGSVEKGGESLVVLIADPTADARFGRTARCDPNGNFTITDVPPGNYTVVAFQDIKLLAQPNPLVRIDSAQGKRVKIAAGATETVTLKAN